MDSSKDAVVLRLAQAHFSVEPGITQIVQLLADAERESDPKEPVKLLEVNENTTADGIRPVFFGPHSASGIYYPSVIVEVTAEEFEAIRHGSLKLPNNWSLGQELPRPEMAAAGGK